MDRFAQAVFAASMIASGSVGWAWMVSADVGKSAPISIASAASLMRSEAPLPTTWMPSTSFDRRVDDDLHEAVGVGVGDGAAERDERELADLDLAARAFASSSVIPGRRDLGIAEDDGRDARTSNSALWPAITSATTSPCLVALCASIGWPAHVADRVDAGHVRALLVGRP